MEDGKPRVHFLDDETTAMVVAERPSSSRSTDSTTLREEERMLVHLKKENFDLKMKIFYMTERLKRSGVRDSEEVRIYIVSTKRTHTHIRQNRI